MLLLVGLGNPGARYSGNRHNIGFRAVEDIAHHFRFSPWRTKFHSEVAQGEIAARIESRQHVIFRYRAGQREPGIMTVEALADALGMRISLVPAARS